MKKLFLFIVAIIITFALSAHPWKPKYYVIVDTDCGFDDLRALSLLLASPEVRILAVTTSNGVLDARSGFMKVKALLGELHHEGLLVGASDDNQVKSVNCTPALNLEWGGFLPDTTDFPTAVEVVDYVLNNINEPVTFLNLGSLNTASSCLDRCNMFAERINKLLWSSKNVLDKDNFNYFLDTIAFRQIVNSNMSLQLVNGETDIECYSTSAADQIREMGGQSAFRIASSITNPDNLYANAIFDEVSVLCMHFQDKFLYDTISSVVRCNLKPDINMNEILAAYGKILSGETVNQTQVLSVFPLDTASYFIDLQAGMKDAIEQYGSEEWIANTITGELHRHLGLYAVIGTKMGIRAKEYFGAGTDELTVVSFAGTRPPYSCLNDGIQVSTGATLGHGLIYIGSDTLKLPCAEFTYLNQTIRVELKEEYRKAIEREINEYSRIYGLSNSIYWELVRHAAIDCWIEWDRNEIFEIMSVLSL